MTWKIILKEDFEDIDSFIKEMKKISQMAMSQFKHFDSKTNSEFDSLEMNDLATAISDMGRAVTVLERMRNTQEELQ